MRFTTGLASQPYLMSAAETITKSSELEDILTEELYAR